MKTVLLIVAVISAVFFAGCKGKTGGTGGAGPQGAPGSVTINSQSVTVNPAGWSQNSNNLGTFYVYFTDNAITDATSDIVECFVNNPNAQPANIWVALPTTNFDIKGDAVDFSFSNNSVTFLYVWSTVPNDPFIFHVVVIPPSVIKKYPNANFKDYSTVNALLQMQNMSIK